MQMERSEYRKHCYHIKLEEWKHIVPKHIDKIIRKNNIESGVPSCTKLF